MRTSSLLLFGRWGTQIINQNKRQKKLLIKFAFSSKTAKNKSSFHISTNQNPFSLIFIDNNQ